jgi:signal transduction histidine kinase/AmiR/NasT family two-component response regulator
LQRSLALSHDLAYAAKRAEIQHEGEEGASIVRHFVQLQQSGVLTREEAQRLALDALKAIRFDGANYVAVLRFDGFSLENPNRFMEGRNVLDLKDVFGRPISRAQLAVAMSGRPGFVAFYFKKIGESESKLKISYNIGILEWGWDVTTGQFSDDLDAEIVNSIIRLTEIITPLFIIFLTIVYVFHRSVSDLLASLSDAMGRLSQGQLDTEIVGRGRTDEIGRMAEALVAFRGAALDKLQLQTASQAKSVFLATISHEIRTPLNGVLGMAQAMEMDELTLVQRERLVVLRNSGQSLLSLLNDILDLSKIEAGKIALETIAFDPAWVVEAIVAQNEVLAASKGLTLQADTAGLHSRYDGDPNRIRQIIQNLVSNGIKFTQSGAVTITATSSNVGLIIQVRDTGMGIPAEKLGKLFAKFQQVDESTTRRFGGTGLGLSICRELAQAMGGDVTVESVDGEGSTFTFSAPLPRSTAAPVADAQAPADAEPRELELRVLAADDNATNQLVLRALLGAAGIEPTIVDNGAEAVAAWRDADWDVILMDVQMPVMDGPTAVKQIRQEEAAGGRAYTAIVALTANTMDHQVREYLDSGMDGFLAKPIAINKLFELLSDVESQRAYRRYTGLRLTTAVATPTL